MNTTLNTPQSEEPDGRLDIAGALARGIQAALSQATEAAGLPEATWTLTLDGPGIRPRLTGVPDISLTADEVQAAVQAYSTLLRAETTSERGHVNMHAEVPVDRAVLTVTVSGLVDEQAYARTLRRTRRRVMDGGDS